MYARGMGEGGSWCGSWPWNLVCDVPEPEYGDIRDRSDATVWMCALPWMHPKLCGVPSQEKIITGGEEYGGHLSEESKRAAEEMARRTVAVDCASHPELYTQIPGSCSYKESDFTIPALVIGGVALLMIFRG